MQCGKVQSTLLGRTVHFRIQQLHPILPPSLTQTVRNKPVPYSPLSQAHIKQLQPTQLLAQLQPEPEKQETETEQHEHAKEKHEPEPEPEPEPSSEHKPLAVLPDNIENPVFSYCTDNACIICPVKTVVKVGEFYVCFPAKDSSNESCEMQHWHSRNNLCFTVKENI